MDADMQSKLLLFWSGSSQPPMFGFKPRFSQNYQEDSEEEEDEDEMWSITFATHTKDTCPQAQTCDRRLILPYYSNIDICRKMITIALTYGSEGYARM